MHSENDIRLGHRFLVEVLAQVALALAIGVFVGLALGGAALLLAA